VKKTLLIIIRYVHLQCNRITSLTVTALISSLRNENWRSSSNLGDKHLIKALQESKKHLAQLYRLL